LKGLLKKEVNDCRRSCDSLRAKKVTINEQKNKMQEYVKLSSFYEPDFFMKKN